MGKLTVTFEAENQDELIRDITQFLTVDAQINTFVWKVKAESDKASIAESIEEPEEKPKKKPGRPKKEKSKPEPEPEVEVVTENLDLSAEIETPPLQEVTREQVIEALQEVLTKKNGQKIAVQLMEEYGGSTKMVEVPEENYSKLFDEIQKVLSA